MSEALKMTPEPGAPISTLEELHSALDAPHHPTMKLGLFLLRQGLVAEADIRAALATKAANPQRRLGEILVENKQLQPHMLTMALSHLMGMPFVHLAALTIEREAVAMLSPALAHRHHVMPVARHRDGLVLACVQPPEPDVMQEISFSVGVYVYPVLASQEDILATLFQHYDSFDEDLAAATNIIHQSTENDYQRLLHDADYLAKQAPIVRLVGYMLSEAIRRRASDVHLRPGGDFVDLFYRLDGTLVRIKRLPIRLLPPMVSRIKILSLLDITERRLPQDGHLKMPYLQQDVDVRVSIIPTSHGESVVMRILNKQAGLRDVHNIGFGPEDEERFIDLIHRSTGMLLVTGPTGSGKTTTLYAALQEVHEDSINIVTVEDPVEYELGGMTQIQLLEQIGFGFPQTLRHILRHDPDIIMIGEIRDSETCKIALDSALSGHLVLSTLHTTDAPSAIIRLQEMGMSHYLIKTALNGVLGQRLIRLNCPHCKEIENVPDVTRSNLGLSDEEEFYRGAGCEACDNTGFHGRAAIYELFVINPVVRAGIKEDMTSLELHELAIKSGMRPLIQHGLEYARAGKASLLEVYRSCM